LEHGETGLVNYPHLTLRTAKAVGFLRSLLSKPYSQRVCQKPFTHSLVIQSVLAFAEYVPSSVNIGIYCYTIC